MLPHGIIVLTPMQTRDQWSVAATRPRGPARSTNTPKPHVMNPTMRMIRIYRLSYVLTHVHRVCRPPSSVRTIVSPGDWYERRNSRSLIEPTFSPFHLMIRSPGTIPPAASFSVSETTCRRPSMASAVNGMRADPTREGIYAIQTARRATSTARKSDVRSVGGFMDPFRKNGLGQDGHQRY